MTVKELKEILSTMDDEKEIWILDKATDYWHSDEDRYVLGYEIDSDGDLFLK